MCRPPAPTRPTRHARSRSSATTRTAISLPNRRGCHGTLATAMAFRSSSQAVQAAAARAGYGIALLPRYLAARDPRLAQVTPGMELLKRELSLLMPRELTRVPRVRAVADYLIELFGKERAAA